MSCIAKELAAEWWKSPDLADVTILRFEEDGRFRFIWEAVGSGKTVRATIAQSAPRLALEKSW